MRSHTLQNLEGIEPADLGEVVEIPESSGVFAGRWFQEGETLLALNASRQSSTSWDTSQGPSPGSSRSAATYLRRGGFREQGVASFRSTTVVRRSADGRSRDARSGGSDALLYVGPEPMTWMGKCHGVYLWDSREASDAYRGSELAGSTAEPYRLREPPVIEIGGVLFPLRE